ncbi:ankyrin repeat domain-containing protein [Microbulbifer spongiae]|uniref:Ankyrin repeat domain-containing protein n=1 Tax=Microbulbifer spongiae TaxID=2944933 RepID=A0ABY9EBD2_9GAMM|nr:ankyrin repeat domain-containing protein [Microbulbifer sp. MI-G]WKD49607.1 ankyrin repeat domain-containing protein [Microbulbifer sp. MI-G]
MRTIEEIYKEVESTPDFSGHKISFANYRNDYGDTPLHIVCNWGDCEAIQALVSEGADLNAIGETGFTPLHCAAEQNKPEVINLLIKLGAQIVTNTNGETPVELAQYLGCMEAVSAFNQNI